MIQDVGFCLRKIFFAWKKDSCHFLYAEFRNRHICEIDSFLVWKENIQILCCNLHTLARDWLLVCLERIVSSLGKFTEIGVRYTFDCRVETTGLLGWFFSTLEIQSVNRWLNLILCGQFVQKACSDELEKEEIRIKVSKRRRYKFQLYINHLHVWPHVVMFEVIGTDLN